MNDTFESIKRTVASGAKKAVEKSNELYDYTKTSLTISALNADIDKEYREMGKLLYMSQKGMEVAPETIEAHIDTVDAKLAEIDACSLRLAKLKNREICPNCNAQILPESMFCANCGERLK